MKLSIKHLFIISLILAAPFPWTIGVGNMEGLYLYEILTILCLLYIILRNPHRNNIDFKVFNQHFLRFKKISALLIIVIVTSVLINFVENITNDNFDYSSVIKIVIHVVISLLVLISAFVCGFLLFDGEKDLKKISYILFISFFITTITTFIKWYNSTGGIISRYNFEPPTGLGQGDTARIIILCFLFTIFLLANFKKNKLFLLLSLIITSISIFIIQSRASYVIFLVQFLLLSYLIVKDSQTKFKFKYFILFLISVVFIIGISYEIESVLGLFTNINENLLNTDSIETHNKLLVIKDGNRIFLDSPFWGVGWGNFGINTTAFLEVSGSGYKVSTPHNGIIQLLAETGIFGTFLALWISLIILQYLYYQYRTNKIRSNKMFFGILLIIFIIAIFSKLIVSSYLFPSPIIRNSIRLSFYHWFIVGYAFSFVKSKQFN